MVNCTLNPPTPCLWQAPASARTQKETSVASVQTRHSGKEAGLFARPIGLSSLHGFTVEAPVKAMGVGGGPVAAVVLCIKRGDI